MPHQVADAHGCAGWVGRLRPKVADPGDDLATWAPPDRDIGTVHDRIQRMVGMHRAHRPPAPDRLVQAMLAKVAGQLGKERLFTSGVLAPEPAGGHTVECVLAVPPIVFASAEPNLKPEADRRLQVCRDSHPAALHRRLGHGHILPEMTDRDGSERYLAIRSATGSFLSPCSRVVAQSPLASAQMTRTSRAMIVNAHHG